MEENNENVKEIDMLPNRIDSRMGDLEHYSQKFNVIINGITNL